MPVIDCPQDLFRDHGTGRPFFFVFLFVGQAPFIYCLADLFGKPLFSSAFHLH